MPWLIAGLAVFLGIHSLRMVAPSWRDARLSAMGEGPWKGIYSLVSLAGLLLLIWGYAVARPEAGILYVPPVWTRHLAWLLMALSFIAMMVFNLPAGKLKPLLKHPMLLSVKLWAFAHLLVNGDLPSLVLFGGLLAWAILEMLVLNRVTPAPVTAHPVPIRKEGMAVVGALVVFFAVGLIHSWLGYNPFGA